MDLKKLGEFGLIAYFKKKIRLDSSVVKGTGDDCAVLKYTKDKYQLFTCDMLIEGVDFLKQDDPYLVGRKSLAVSVSDIAACCGNPKYCLVSLGLPAKTPWPYLKRLFQGMLVLARQYKINLVGGDLSRAGKLTIDISMLGEVKKKELALRSGAKKGDILLVSGRLGGSIRGRHLRFLPRLKEARYLAKNFKPSAIIDISDGLVQDLSHILAASKVGAFLYAELIPLSEAAKGLSEALYMGEDFELLFTLKRRRVRKLLAQKKYRFYPLGEITSQKYGLKLITPEGKEKSIQPKGFRHF